MNFDDRDHDIDPEPDNGDILIIGLTFLIAMAVLEVLGRLS